MPSVKHCRFAFVSACLAFLTTAAVRADMDRPSTYQLFGISSGFNDVFFGDYYGRNGDIEGHAAVKGNLDARDYGFGGGEQAKHADDRNVLVVGGNAIVKGVGVFDGNAYVAGNVVNASSDKWNTMGAEGTGPAIYNRENPDYVGTRGTVYADGFPTGTPDRNAQRQEYLSQSGHSSIPFDFTLAEAQLRQTSSDLWDYADTVTGTFANGNYEIDLTGKTGLQVITIDASVFMALGTNKNIYIDAGADTTLLVNVTNDAGLDYLWFRNELVINGNPDEMRSDFDGSNILFNTAMDDVRIENVAFNASLVALDAEVFIAHGNIEGQVFAGSGRTIDGGEFHAYYTFDDKHFGAATPEPASIMILGIGLAGLGIVRRRKIARFV